MTPAPDISVVVAERNSRSRLEPTLRALQYQHAPDFKYEVIVVDNASDDGTTEWLKEVAEEFAIRVVEESQPGLAFARNAGIRSALGSIIAFVDDDAVPAVHWLHALNRTFQRTGADAAGGPAHGLWERTPPNHLVPRTWRGLSLISYGNAEKQLVWPQILLGTNMAFRRDVFDRIGLFDTNSFGRTADNMLANDDRELQKRLYDAGGKIVYEPSAWVFHLVTEGRMATSYFEKRMEGAAASHMLLTARETGLPVSQLTGFDHLQEPAWKKRLRHLDSKYLLGFLARMSLAVQARDLALNYYRFEVKQYKAIRRGISLGRKLTGNKENPNKYE